MRAIGSKLIDIRVQDPSDNIKDYSTFKENDWLHFEDTNHEVLKAAVRYCKHYNQIENLLLIESVKDVWHNAKTIEEAVEKSIRFPGYAERIKEQGVYAIGIKKLAVYVAGPYSSESKEEKIKNIRKAESDAKEIAKLGYIPLVPHKLFELWEDAGFSQEECMALEKDLLRDKSDIFYFKELSAGTRKEIKLALPIMPVFMGLDNLRFWKPVNAELKA